MLKVTKFGGSSLCDSAAFLRVRELVLSDPARRVVVVSAAGKRHTADHKITDLLYLCHAHLQYGVSCWDLWRRISDRYREIRDGCALNVPVDEILSGMYAAFSPGASRDWIVSRGEYLSAVLMAELLGFTFVDAKDWLQFDACGRIRQEASYAALRSLADGRKIVTPGFYGVNPDGTIRTLSRGGSDVTGALAAAALRADLYENWTDVPGILTADPRIIRQPSPVRQLRYEDLQTLSRVGLQVLHESAVAPVWQAGIALRICSTLQPELPGTLIQPQLEPQAAQPEICFAGRRQLAMLRISRLREGCSPEQLFVRERLRMVCTQEVCGHLTAIFDMQTGMQQLQERASAELAADGCTLRENLSLIAALCRSTAAVPELLRAIEGSGAPVHHLCRRGECILLLVNDSQYEMALRAAYAAAQRIKD